MSAILQSNTESTMQSSLKTGLEKGGFTSDVKFDLDDTQLTLYMRPDKRMSIEVYSMGLPTEYTEKMKLDGFWEKDLNLWDVSSGVLLVKEAGGRVTEPQGNNWTTKSRDILVSNTLIHEKLLENLTLL